MIAEGSSSSSQTPFPRGGPPQSERDLLAERRALRAAESGESALVRRAEVAEATVETLEGHVCNLQRRLEEAEQDGRRTSELAERLETVESALGAIREGHRRMASTVGELKDMAMRLRAALDSEPARESIQPRREEMADALAAAVERLRARAQTGPETQPAASVPAIVREPHKHSLSLIGRWRRRRKQRRGR